MKYEERKKKARIAGLLYLALGIFGGFGIMYIPMNIMVVGDAEATVTNILSNEFLFRLSMVSNLISQACFLFLVLALNQLLKDVNPKRAKLMVNLVIVSVPIAFLNILNPLAALIFAQGDSSLGAFNTDQLQTLSMVFLKLYEYGLMIVGVFWGLWLFPFGLLIIKSKFIPRIIGIFLVVGCFSYLLESLTGILFPQYKDMVSMVMMLPLALGEFSIIFWLLIKGIKNNESQLT